MKHTPKEIIESARTTIIPILPLQILPAHKNELLSVLFWKITQVNGKYNLRYHSEDVKSGNNPKNKIRHEHVYTKKWLSQQLIAKPESVDTIIEKVVACLVTKEEHARLHKVPREYVGWDRYTHAGIRVYDTKEKCWIT